MKRIGIIFFVRDHRSGFTLTEILVVIIIISILATLSLPMLVKTLEKAKVGEAVSNLNLIRTGEKIYFLENGFFAGDGEAGINSLNIENPNSSSAYFIYTIVTEKGSKSDFEATATRKDNAPSPYNDDVYKIHKDGAITGPLIY